MRKVPGKLRFYARNVSAPRYLYRIRWKPLGYTHVRTINVTEPTRYVINVSPSETVSWPDINYVHIIRFRYYL
jgi:hypothetical protein